MRLLIDLQVLQRPNRLDPWRTCLERLLPALIEAAPAQGMTPHLLLNAAWPKTLPPLYRRFADLYRNGQIHVFHGVTTGVPPSPACLHLQAFGSAGLSPDLVLCPGGPEEADHNAWLARLLPDGLPVHDIYRAKSYEKIKFFNVLDSSYAPPAPPAGLGLPRPYVLCIGPAEVAGQRPMTDLIAAFAALPRAQQQAWDLVLAGQFTAAEKQALIRWRHPWPAGASPAPPARPHHRSQCSTDRRGRPCCRSDHAKRAEWRHAGGRRGRGACAGRRYAAAPRHSGGR